MSHQQEDDEYMGDEYEMEDVDDNMEEEFHGRDVGSYSDVDEYDYMVYISLYYMDMDWILMDGNN